MTQSIEMHFVKADAPTNATGRAQIAIKQGGDVVVVALGDIPDFINTLRHTAALGGVQTHLDEHQRLAGEYTGMKG